MNVIVEKKNNESGMNLLRRFSRKARAIGFLTKVRKKRYYTRLESGLKKKKSALIKIAAAEKYNTLMKMGKITPRNQQH